MTLTTVIMRSFEYDDVVISLEIQPTRVMNVKTDAHLMEIHQRGNLCEQAQYDFRLSSVSPIKCYLRENRYITNHKGSHTVGSINTLGYCGYLECTLCIEQGDEIQHITQYIQVESVKLRYDIEYRSMLRYLSNKCNQLLFDASAPVSNQFFTVFDDEVITEQQYEFLRNTIDHELAECLAIVMHSPYEILKNEDTVIPVSRISKMTRHLQHQIAASSNRTRLPESLQLGNLDSIPQHVTKVHRVSTVNSPENQFVKKIIMDFYRLVLHIQEKLVQYSRNNLTNDKQFMQQDVERLIKQIESILHRPFFREIPESSRILTHSTVMQQRRGYRDLLKIWMRFVNGSRFEFLQNNDDSQMLFKAGSRDAAALYEYWLFFQLIEMFQSVFHVQEKLSDKLVKYTDSAYQQVVLQKGTAVGFEGQYYGRTRNITAKFWYNKAFSVQHRNVYEMQGSWTQAFTPDYTISLWPAAFSESEAEANETILHIHFDAKYRATIKSIFGDDQEVIRNSEEVKASDIIKMHAYRDAIRRTVGAFVLYPSSLENVQNSSPMDIYQRHVNEILPSVGAIAVSCDDNGDAMGIANVKQFLMKIVDHMQARSSLRENITYHMYDYMRSNTTAQYFQPHRQTYAEFIGQDKLRLAPANQIQLLSKKVQYVWEVLCAEAVGGFVSVKIPYTNKEKKYHVQDVYLQIRYIIMVDSSVNTTTTTTHYFERMTNHIDIVDTHELIRRIQHLVQKGNIDFPVDDGSMYMLFDTKSTSVISDVASDWQLTSDYNKNTHVGRRIYENNEFYIQSLHDYLN